ncbi:MAG: NUDIX hydrolase [Rhizobiaceae bacterium]
MILQASRRIRFVEWLRGILGAPLVAHQAAALVWRRGRKGPEILLITSRDTGRWVLPKGWPEAGECLADAARREAAEEAGIRGRASGQCLGRYYFDKHLDNGVVRRCQVDVYPVLVKRQVKNWPEKSARYQVWVPLRTAAKMVAEPDLAEIIRSFGGQAVKDAA